MRLGSVFFLLLLSAGCVSGSATDETEDSGPVMPDADPVPDPPDCDVDGDGVDGPQCSGLDCDDTDAGRHPGAEEVCDGTDNDCTGVSDDDDSAATIHPGAVETCDGVDQDCDGVVDNDAVGLLTTYADSDGDGFGDGAAAHVGCDVPAGNVFSDADCDDADGGVHPGATEQCDGQDQDCDGEVDESAPSAPLWFSDGDGDGYGVSGSAVRACDQPVEHVVVHAEQQRLARCELPGDRVLGSPLLSAEGRRAAAT